MENLTCPNFAVLGASGRADSSGTPQKADKSQNTLFWRRYFPQLCHSLDETVMRNRVVTERMKTVSDVY